MININDLKIEQEKYIKDKISDYIKNLENRIDFKVRGNFVTTYIAFQDDKEKEVKYYGLKEDAGFDIFFDRHIDDIVTNVLIKYKENGWDFFYRKTSDHYYIGVLVP